MNGAMPWKAMQQVFEFRRPPMNDNAVGHYGG
jgi:hypothetical protein